MNSHTSMFNADQRVKISVRHYSLSGHHQSVSLYRRSTLLNSGIWWSF